MNENDMKTFKEFIDERAKKTERRFDERVSETKRHFDVVAEDLRSDLRIIAEGQALLNTKSDKMREEILTEMRSGFEEVRSAIRFSYAELDKRVSTLESDVTDLTHRIERVEDKSIGRGEVEKDVR